VRIAVAFTGLSKTQNSSMNLSQQKIKIQIPEIKGQLYIVFVWWSNLKLSRAE
jgi:hypothetical protein